MIKYALVCDSAHGFESWFRDSAAYEVQVKRGLVTCPDCGSAKVDKAIMAPSVARPLRLGQEHSPNSSASPAASEGAARPVALLDEKQAELRMMLRRLHAKIIEHTDDVGSRFPEEARRMHEGDIPHRSIRGEASPDDARSLWEDGIEILPIPRLPEEFN